MKKLGTFTSIIALIEYFRRFANSYDRQVVIEDI